MSDPSPLKIGILVPSSNTALEPLTTSILSSLPHISVHFSRFPVTEISLSASALAQFESTNIESSPIIAAAKLLADAKVDVIGWSGTSGGWLGFEVDEKLCESIEKVTGVRATTSTLGLNRVMGLVSSNHCGGAVGVLGLVTPYVDDVQAAIVRQYGSGKEGWRVVESHLGVKENWRIAEVGEERLTEQVRDVMERSGRKEGEVMVVSSFCTNLKAAQLAERWEGMFEGIVVADTVATVVWDALRLVGRQEEARQIKGWGKMFQL
jgi:maleate isomerase